LGVAIAKKGQSSRQYAALPLMIGAEGYRVVLLITSRERGRWVLPKGWPKPGIVPYRQAANEAFEEAGVTGKIGRTTIGRYVYVKLLRDGRKVACRVDVFPLAVDNILDDWPERGQRDLGWFTLGEAAALVEEPGLSGLLLDIAAGNHGCMMPRLRRLDPAAWCERGRQVGCQLAAG
jgi:8-oxo-dGTP pyrophosphatase MutT (NUDIX family)